MSTRPKIRLAEVVTLLPEAAESTSPLGSPPATSRLPVPRLLWGWREVLEATNIPRRTLERELSAGRFPKPVKRVGRRPFWRPADVAAWAEGGGRS
jgi:predicted DNA-binding transcriptional regulator AlpA